MTRRRLVIVGTVGIISLSAPGVVRPQNQAANPSPQTDATKSETKTIVNQKLAGTLYTNGASSFTLIVPEGWQANDNLVEPRFGVGALTAPDGEADLVIQLMLASDSPKAFLKKLDSSLPSRFSRYRTLGESKLTVAGKQCEVLTFGYVQHRTVAGVAVEMPTVSRMVLVPREYGFLLFNFVTLESIFDKQLPTFDRIMSSYRSTASDATGTKTN